MLSDFRVQETDNVHESAVPWAPVVTAFLPTSGERSCGRQELKSGRECSFLSHLLS